MESDNVFVIMDNFVNTISDKAIRNLIPVTFLQDTIATIEHGRPVSETAEIGAQLAVQFLRETIADWRDKMTKEERRQWLNQH